MQLHLGEYIQSGWLAGKDKEGVDIKFCRLMRFLPDGSNLEIMCQVKPEDGNKEMLLALANGYNDLCEYSGESNDAIVVDKS